MTVTRVLPVFSVVFAIAYVLAMENNIAMVTYHPQLGVWGWGVQPPTKTGPAMYWYGWLATATLAGLVGALLTVGVPRALASRVPEWLSWAIPLAMMLTVIVLLRGYFLR
jgi:hypothetical protein